MTGESAWMSICALRVSRCGANGRPDWGNVSGAWCAQEVGMLQYSPDILTGTDVAELNGCGNLSVVKKYPDKIKRMNLTIEFNSTAYQLHEIIADQPLVVNGATPVGVAVKAQAGCGTQTAQKACVIEAWVESILCGDANPTTPYIRFVFPKCYMHNAGGTLQMGLNKQRFEGFAQAASGFGHGPFGDLDLLDTGTYPTLSGFVMAALDDAALPTVCGTGAYISLAPYTSSS
jgi:hypothetical protein